MHEFFICRDLEILHNFRTFAFAMNYQELWRRLAQVYDEGEAKAIARLVYDVRFNLTLSDLFIGKDTQLSANDQAELAEITQRLEQQEPVQYVLGQADFCGGHGAGHGQEHFTTLVQEVFVGFCSIYQGCGIEVTVVMGNELRDRSLFHFVKKRPRGEASL